MVATLVRLRWRLIANYLRTNVWATIAAVLGAAWGLAVFVIVMSAATALGRVDAATLTAVLGGVGGAVVVGWALIPLLYSGVDSTLDPRALAAWIAPSYRLSVGLAVAGATGIPGIVTGLALLTPALAWMVSGHGAAALMSLLLAPAALATCVLLARIVVIGTGVSTSRRGRDAAAVLGFIVFFALALTPRLLDSAVLDVDGAGVSVLAVGRIAGLTPLGWALAAPGYFAQGRVLLALALGVGAMAVPVALMPPWHRVVRRVMTGPTRATAAARTRRADRRHGPDAAPAVLPWQRRLEHLVSTLTAAVAARCLRYWRSDPRYLIQVVAFMTLLLVFGMGVLNNYSMANGTPPTLSPGGAPSGLFLMLPAAGLLFGWIMHNDLAYDSTALWTHQAAGTSGRSDRLGRVIAAAIWQLPFMLVVAGVLTWLVGDWRKAAVCLGATFSLYGCALAWSSLTSVLLPYETNAPEESIWKSRSSGTAFVAAIIQLIGISVICLGALPVLVPAIRMAVTDSWQWGWAVGIGGLVWGVTATGIGVVFGGKLLDRRWVRVLTAIRAWPGHDETR
ncbi:transporter [Actinomyces sp. MRS3W]|uniref:transporter n=1 Tax=Actinomyces sp. MRS3W TaxID=2800796 RepID=UPI0028FDA0AD|nr:transporter [Actinomyces sp. MRS3W]MDU0347550.1 transporter [Actinomyces sp. MRS3W]